MSFAKRFPQPFLSSAAMLVGTCALLWGSPARADEVPLPPTAVGIWVREIPEGKTTMYASLYLGRDNKYAVSYSGGKKPKPGEYGSVKSENGKWFLDPESAKALKRPFSVEGDKLLLMAGSDKLIWKRPPGPEEPLLFAKALEPKATDAKVFAWLQEGPSKSRTVLIPQSRQMLATADGLTQLFNKIEPAKPEMTITHEVDGSDTITMKNGTIIHMRQGAPPVMDSGDPDADGIFNSSMAGDYNTAIDFAQKLLKRDPNNTSTYVNLAEIAFKKGDFENEIFFAEHAITLSLMGYFTPGDSRGLQQSRAASMLDLTAKESINQILGNAYRHRGVGQLALGNNSQAAEDFTRSIGYASPPIPDTYMYRAEARSMLKLNSDALADAEEAIRRDPTNEMAYCVRGMIHNRLGHPFEAQADVQKAISIEPDITDQCRKLQAS